MIMNQHQRALESSCTLTSELASGLAFMLAFMLAFASTGLTQGSAKPHKPAMTRSRATSRATSHVEPRVEPRVRGEVSRAAVEEAARGGLPHILAELRVKPARARGRFVGFELAWIKSGSLAERAGFKVGDVIKRVNDEPIGRPDQMIHALSLLPFAGEVRIELERARSTRVWVWRIN